MKVLIYFGDDYLNLDKAVLEIKKKYPKQIDYSEKISELSLSALQIDLQSPGFFPEQKLFIFYDIFTHQINRGKISEKIQNTLSYLNKMQISNLDADLLFVESDANKKKYYEQFFPKAVYKSFKLSPNLFYFLDNFYPQNLNKCFDYYQRALQSNPAELVFHMLKRRVKELILILNNELKGNYQPWQLGKLKSQAKNWKSEKLVEIYKTLFRIEKNLKTGITPLNIQSSLNILLTHYL